VEKIGAVVRGKNIAPWKEFTDFFPPATSRGLKKQLMMLGAWKKRKRFPPKIVFSGFREKTRLTAGKLVRAGSRKH
jgi:hypothetical protein